MLKTNNFHFRLQRDRTIAVDLSIRLKVTAFPRKSELERATAYWRRFKGDVQRIG